MQRSFEPLLQVADVPREQIPIVLGQLAAAQSALLARLLEQPPEERPQPEPENYLSVEEAAKRWHRSPRWFYRHAKRLTFCKRLSRKVLLVGEKGMERWLAIQKV
jgi:hypothetical protein